MNLYAYVLNNPLRYVDPTGHDPTPDYYGDEEQKKMHASPHITTLEFNAEAAAQVERGIGSYADWGLGPVLTEMSDIFAEPMLVAEPSPTGVEVAAQMLTGINDSLDPMGAMIQRAMESLTGLSSGVDRNSLGYRAGNELIGPMVGIAASGAGGIAAGTSTAVERGSIMLGEKMVERVIPAARQLGMNILTPEVNITPMEGVGMLKGAIKEGARIFSIGPLGKVPVQPHFIMESTFLRRAGFTPEMTRQTVTIGKSIINVLQYVRR